MIHLFDYESKIRSSVLFEPLYSTLLSRPFLPSFTKKYATHMRYTWPVATPRLKHNSSGVNSGID